MIPDFADFRASLPQDPALIAQGLIGKGLRYDRGYGAVEMVYADYIASGRALSFVEDFIRDRVLPFYANSHTEDSLCGGAITALREAARAEILRLCGGGSEHAAIFAGAGATAGINRLVHLLDAARAVVLIGPYEHHSNILPWREAGAEVVEIAEALGGGVDLAALEAALAAAHGPVIGAFSAMSNVSGRLTDVVAVTQALKRAGALAVWDYAGAGPYLPIAMTPAPDAPIDAIVLSPHKFPGGPGASGVMVLRRDAVRCTRPSFPGGGTVRFVSSAGQDYHRCVELREEGGTPNVLGDIRAGMVLAVKEAMGVDWIAARNADLAARLWRVLAETPRLAPMGAGASGQVPVLSFRVRCGDGFYNYKLATTLLSDQFGVQARGGCACAGPYVFRLAGMGAALTEEVRGEIAADNFARKPGFVRLNLSCLMSEAEVKTVLAALRALPEALDAAAKDYRRSSAAGPFLRIA